MPFVVLACAEVSAPQRAAPGRCAGCSTSRRAGSSWFATSRRRARHGTEPRLAPSPHVPASGSVRPSSRGRGRDGGRPTSYATGMGRPPVTCAALAALALTSLAGCALRLAPRAETVTEAPGGMWIAGGDGLAAFSDGRTVTRRDYPMKGAPDWAYQYGTPFHNAYPAARVVMLGETPWLVTKYAGVMRWNGAAWEPRPVRWPLADTHQVDFAARAPNGSLVIQFRKLSFAGLDVSGV